MTWVSRLIADDTAQAWQALCAPGSDRERARIVLCSHKDARVRMRAKRVVHECEPRAKVDEILVKSISKRLIDTEDECRSKLGGVLDAFFYASRFGVLELAVSIRV